MSTPDDYYQVHQQEGLYGYRRYQHGLYRTGRPARYPSLTALLADLPLDLPVFHQGRWISSENALTA